MIYNGRCICVIDKRQSALNLYSWESVTRLIQKASEVGLAQVKDSTIREPYEAQSQERTFKGVNIADSDLSMVGIWMLRSVSLIFVFCVLCFVFCVLCFVRLRCRCRQLDCNLLGMISPCKHWVGPRSAMVTGRTGLVHVNWCSRMCHR
jgi:hypothetical protein